MEIGQATLYKPTWSSFFASAAYSLSPGALAGTVTFFIWEEAGALMLIVGTLMGLLSLILLVQDVFVHLQRVYVDERCLTLVSPLGRQLIAWSDLTGAVLKERNNAMTRTDRLLLLQGQTSRVLFCPSTLSEIDEQRLLRFVRSKTVVVVEQSKPAI